MDVNIFKCILHLARDRGHLHSSKSTTTGRGIHQETVVKKWNPEICILGFDF